MCCLRVGSVYEIGLKTCGRSANEAGVKRVGDAPAKKLLCSIPYCEFEADCDNCEKNGEAS